MNTIKVLVLTTSFPLRENSVSGLFVKRLVDNLSPKVKPVVLVPCDSKNHDAEKQADYEVKCFKYAPRRWQIFAHKPGGIPAALESNKLMYLMIPAFLFAMFIQCYKEAKYVDLIHANWSISGVVGGLVGKILSKPTITTIRGEDGNKAESSIVFKVLLKLAIYFSTRVVGVSENLVNKAKSISKCGSSKILCVPNGIERDLISHNQPFRPDVTKELVLISVGNLTENKNIALIIEAVREIMSQGEKVTLSIVGDGPKKIELKNLIEKYDLSKSVHLRGKLPPEKVYELIRKSNFFVLSSFREGRPNVLLESMALGTPIIASNIDGVAELIKDGHSGLLYDPHSCKELVKCINRIAQNTNLQKELRTNALSYLVENNLFWDESAGKYFDIYKNALQNY